MNRLAYLAGLSGTLLMLAGCTTGFLNEGATQVRASTPHGGGFEGIYFYKPAETGMNLIDENEAFSISLLSAHICGFRESMGLDLLRRDHSNRSTTGHAGCSNGGAESPGGAARTTRGEIAIVANTGEISSARTPVFNPADTGAKGRVIYYNDDVRESGQLINAINLPIYGPKLYGGKNVFLDLWMLELDNQESKKLKGLLESLADLGGKAYPPGAPILGILNTLGSALLAGNQDDVEAHFQMRFDVPGDKDVSSIARLHLAEGYYAFVREEDRDRSPAWADLAIDEHRGVLCRASQGKCIAPAVNSPYSDNIYRDRTWFLIRVAKETKAAAQDIEYGETLNDFMKRLEAHQESDLQALKSAMGNFWQSLDDKNGK